jgi:uracil-DNA glycosylase family 4
MKPEGCQGCPCLKMGDDFSAVEVGSRYKQTGLLLVGEASGQSEARDQLPFRPHGQSGSLLADSMRETNLTRNDVAITNILRCRPKNDWIDGAPFQYAATNQCITTYLIEAIRELKPRVILALGGTAFRALTSVPKGRTSTLDYLRGYAVMGSGAAEGVPVIGTYHPAGIRRGSAHLIPLLQRDLRRAFLIATGKLIAGTHYILDPLSHGGAYQVMPSVEEAWDWFRNIDPNKSIYADIETPRSRREDEDDRNSFADRDINLIQFTQRRGSGIALPWRDDYIDVGKAILATSNRKVGHNWFGFDLPVLAANNIAVEGEQDDTMLQFHHYQPDLPQNLQAVAQYCGFPFAWKHLADSEPELYGCIDVDATCWADETMTALLRRDGLHDSYTRYVQTFWPILRDMSTRGLPISEEKRVALKEVIVEEGIRADAAIKAIVPAEVLTQKQKFGYKNPPILNCEECGYAGRGDHFCLDQWMEEAMFQMIVMLFLDRRNYGQSLMPNSPKPTDLLEEK